MGENFKRGRHGYSCTLRIRPAFDADLLPARFLVGVHQMPVIIVADVDVHAIQQRFHYRNPMGGDNNVAYPNSRLRGTPCARCQYRLMAARRRRSLRRRQ